MLFPTSVDLTVHCRFVGLYFDVGKGLSCYISKREIIFGQPIINNYGDNPFSSILIGI